MGGARVSLADLQVSDWTAFDENEASGYCADLAAALPLPVTFKEIRDHGYAGRSFRLALFEHDGATFSLLPGGEVRLGFDPEDLRLTEEQEASYRESAEELQIGLDLRGFIDSVTTAPRLVQVEPLLVEVRVRETGLEPISPETPEVKRLLKDHPAGNAELHADDVITRINRRQDGSIAAWRIIRPPHSEIVSDLEAQGCRLLTGDEWEYACGAEARTLFRWGDFFPCDRYPTDSTPEERRRATLWALSAGRIPFVPDEPDWTLHLEPNLFGLEIAQSPYDWETVAEERSVRGGDGGVNICGGVGFFMGWLPLASAYCDPNFDVWMEEGIRPNFVRRVVPLDL